MADQQRAMPLDLIRHVEVALDVAARAVDLAVRDDGTTPTPTGTGAPPLNLSKVVADTAMLLRVAAPLGRVHPRIARNVNRLAHQLAPLARGEQLLTLLCREPSFALDRAAAHLHLRDLGHADDGVDRLVAMALHAEAARSPERLPSDELEHEWLRSIWNRSVDDADRAALLNRTCAAGPIDALGSSIGDLYALTYVVLCATDMGARTVAWPRPLAELVADAEAGLAAALDADNFDLAAELLWSWPMLHMPWSPVATFTFGVLTAAAHAHGFLPGPGYRSEVAAVLDAEAADAYALRTSYHATYALGFAAAVSARTGCVPASDSPFGNASITAPSTSAVDELLRLVRGDGSAPSWLDAFERAPAGLRAQLADLLVTALLRRAHAANDLTSLRDTLAIASTADLLRGPAVRQAAALLRRATILDQLTDRTPATLVGRDCA